MKTAAKRLAGKTAARLGFNRRRQGHRALVLMLHRVLADTDFAQLQFQRSLALSQQGLELLLRFLQRQYTLIQLDDYLALPEQALGRERFACLTFDDGWQDNFTQAWPVLSAHQSPASIYLSTGFIGAQRHFWWQTWGDIICALPPAQWQMLQRQLAQLAPTLADADSVDTLIHRGKSLSPDERESVTQILTGYSDHAASHGMHWNQVRTLSASGLIRFGTHTVNHVLLPQLDDAAAMDEISRCAEDLRAQPGVCFNGIFCYPNGDRDARIERMVQQAGYTAALGTQRGFASQAPAERFHLPRVNVTEALVRDPSLFQYRLLKAAGHHRR